MPIEYECFIVVDYDDKVTFDYVEGEDRHFLKIKKLDEVENLVKYFNRYKRKRILQKSDDYVCEDIIKYFSDIWMLHDRFIYMFHNGKWYIFYYRCENDVIFKLIKNLF